MYDFICEHCSGTLRQRRVKREALRHTGGFVILEDVPIGVCDKCGARYFDASEAVNLSEKTRKLFRPNGVQCFVRFDRLGKPENE